MGNRLSYVKRTQTTKHPNKTDVAESAFYSYNDSNQLVSAKLFDGKKNTTVTYTYDENGNLISEIGEYGVEQVETYYDYTVENRLQAVYNADELLMAAAYDGDGNRVFQLNYNLHTDEDWKDNSGNGNGNNKDNAGSGNNGNGNGNSGNNDNGSTGNNGNPGNSGNGKGDGNTGNTGNSGDGNDKENSKSEGTDDAGYGNATNAEEHNSQNQSGILFPIAEEVSRTETDLIAMIKTTGKEKDYELIEYISNVNTQYTQVLMELNENGAMDAAYTYGVSRLTEDRFTGESNFYLYDPAGNVAGITDQDGYLWQSYRYDAFGNATFGSPQYDNEYTFNGESYNPNIQSQYLRARYYDTVKGSFLTEDTYLGDIRNPLTLNRYSYCIGNLLFYRDPSGYDPTPVGITDGDAVEAYTISVIMEHQNEVNQVMDKVFNWLGESSGLHNRSTADQVLNGFVAGVAGSYYDTWNAITSPEYICASLDYALRHPIQTSIGVLQFFLGGSDRAAKIYQDIKAENYRAAAQKVGYEVGKLSQVALAAAMTNKCGDVISNKRAKSTGTVAGNSPTQTLLFGEEWYNYFQETYGASNVEWTSGIIEDMLRTQGWAYTPYTGKKIRNYGSPNKIASLLDEKPELVGSTRDKLLATVQDSELNGIVDQLYRPGASVGDGGTAAIVVEEFSKGSSKHLLKATERLNQLKKLVNSGKLGLNDLDIAEALIDDLESAISLYD